jgi:dephospho-CoA kinase|tara:strand:+ start:534 stop:1103 length:570 start_codon:yes stop_codon:yes gene_type:complete
MIKIGILGEIGAGKSYVATNFGYPVFNADYEVAELYKKNKKLFYKLKKILPKYISKFPIDKKEISSAILDHNNNLKKIVKIVHSEVRKKMQLFLKKNYRAKIIILDIPLLLENNINDKNDILVFVDSKKSEILKRLKKRKNFNLKIFQMFKDIQLSSNYKKKKSHFIIKNDFKKKSVKIGINNVLERIT